MSDNGNNVHFSGVRFICSHLIPWFARADNDKMLASDESYARKINILVIIKIRLFEHEFQARNFGQL